VSLKALIAALTTTVLTAAPALALPNPPVFPIGASPIARVPEVSSNGSLAAIVAVAALAMIVWERRRARTQ
jgi:hypothetical protein